MINKLKPKSEFSRNILTPMTGTTIAQAIPIVGLPIMIRWLKNLKKDWLK